MKQTADLMRHYQVAANREFFQVTCEEREELERWAQSRSLPAGDVFRARLILALADGWSYPEIERRYGASAPTVSLWKHLFEENRVAGLQGQHKGSKPRRARWTYTDPKRRMHAKEITGTAYRRLVLARSIAGCNLN